MLEQHEDQAQSMKSSSRAESRAELKCRVEAKNAQVQNSSSTGQVQCTRAVIEYKDRAEDLLQQKERLALGAHLGRGRICMLVGHPSSLFQLNMVHLRKPALGTAQKQCLIRYRSRLKNQLVKDKPAGQNLQEQTVKEDLSSEDDEGQLERRSADKSLEELLKSGCKREENKRSLNSVMEQPARTKTRSKQIKLMNRLASWLKSDQLR
ncbi:hypothetical protein F511_37731 [Dorcoceras hygrometricum]|uniref:Uncharacterized protein n=1 Tax=Dorcoceras hygrometricum TaxID=472368 RepID=A0A2Z7AAV6_9LAMI|nr:hypothetical protein F511_37731 [Dorcoceras hygrometricum]